MKKILIFAATAAFMVFCPAGANAAKVDLGRYTIVYSASAEEEEGLEIATLLQQVIKDQTGAELPIVSDETQAVKKEILIGRTSRPESAAFYEAGPDTFDYSVSFKKGKLVVAGGGCWALAEAVRQIPAKPDAAIKLKGSIYGRMIFLREEGTNLRILDDNIWDYGKENNSPAWEAVGADCRDIVRARGLAEIVYAFMPDILCMQEYSDKMDPILRPMLEEKGYKIAFVPGEQWNHTPIFYQPSAVTLKETKYHRYTPEMWSNKGSKSYNWAMFTLNATGKDFFVINTHLWWKSDKVQEGSTEARASQVREMMKESERAVVLNDVPVFMMGDMNCNLSSKPMIQLLDWGYKPVSWIAKVYGDPRNGHHECNNNAFSRKKNKSDENGMGAIDQFFLYNGGDTEILVFKRVQAYFTVPITDHYPNYVDAILK